MSAFLVTVISSTAGGILASLIAIFIWEQYKKPKLNIEIPQKVPGQEPSPQTQFSRAFYHLGVKNTGKSPAYTCRVIMRFFDRDHNTQLFSPVNGKWDRGPQPIIHSPVPVEVLPDGKIKVATMETLQDFIIPFAETIDIHPRMPSEGFCVVVKYENENECWPFSSWSYILGQGHRVKEWQLNQGRYVVEIELLYSGKGSIKRKFLLINEGTSMNSVEIKSYDAETGRNTLAKAFSKVRAWWKRYGSIPFVVAAAINIFLLVYALAWIPEIKPIVKATYTCQNLAGTLALFVALHEARSKKSKIILTVAIELFILGFFAQFLSFLS